MTRWPIVRLEAELDVAQAALWYEAERSGLGGEYVREVDALFARIAESSEQFPEIGEGVRRGLLWRFPYGVYFVTETDPPTILAVLHHRRHPRTWMRRR